MQIGPGANPTGNYTIHVTAPLGAHLYNAFSMRAGFVNGQTPDLMKNHRVALYAADRFTMNAHYQVEGLTVPIARVDPSHVGRTLKFESFDVGDARTTVPYLELSPSADMRTGNGALGSVGCYFTGPSRVRQWIKPCRVNNIDARDFSGLISRCEVPIPNDYKCDYTSKTGCWLMLEVNYGANNVGGDTSSWNIEDKSAPPRLHNSKRFNF